MRQVCIALLILSGIVGCQCHAANEYAPQPSQLLASERETLKGMSTSTVRIERLLKRLKLNVKAPACVKVPGC